MGITEREKHIENLKTLVAFLEVNSIFKLSDEMYKSFDYAISSLKTDLKYDLMYEGGEIFTKTDMVAMLTDIQLEIEELDLKDSVPDYQKGAEETREYISDLLQQKIDALKGKQEAADGKD